MVYAMEKHKDQKRKYTGEPYSSHLAEVAGIVSSVIKSEHVTAIAWLHDVIEDQGVNYEALAEIFGDGIATDVAWLTDQEVGNRKERKAAACRRLGSAPSWVQSIKCADLISNTKSIVQHDKKFAAVYLQEKRELLGHLTKADENLLSLAWKVLEESEEKLREES